MATDYRTGMDVLDEDECWALLRSAEVGRLAMLIGQELEIFPVNFAVDDRTVIFRTAAGTKLAAVVLGGIAAVEADGYDADRSEAWSVVVKGHAVEVERSDELVELRELPLFPWLTSPKPRFIRLEPRSVTGRRFRVTAAAGPATGPTGARHPAN